LSKRYMIAAQIVKAVENIDQQVSEPSWVETIFQK
jgi:hypothetical protein